MNGHGWVIPNPDGSKARCGGPALCRVCALESTAKQAVTPWMTRAEAAEYMRRSPDTLARWERAKEGPPIHRVKDRPMYLRSEVDAWMREQGADS